MLLSIVDEETLNPRGASGHRPTVLFRGPSPATDSNDDFKQPSRVSARSPTGFPRGECH